MRNDGFEPAAAVQPSTETCPRCGQQALGRKIIPHRFAYGEAESKVELEALVPLQACSACGFSFLDDEAEEACHAAVCAHFGLLTPLQIRQLRERYGFSRSELGRIAGIGVASLARWERGELLQNAAGDRLLRLLQFSENVERLAGVAGIQLPSVVRRSRHGASRFRALGDVSALRVQQGNFRLAGPRAR